METKKFDIAVIITLIISIAGGIFWLGKLDAKVEVVNTERFNLKVEKTLLEIEKAKDLIGQQLPVGTIIASILEPSIFLSNGISRKWHLADNSTIPADSKYLNLVENANIESKERLPDLRGVFIRGLNEGRDDGKEDLNGNERLSGSFQMGNYRQHNHSFSGNAVSKGGNGGTGKVLAVGDHSNFGNYRPSGSIGNSGGVETRPKNVAVYYYIKIN